MGNRRNIFHEAIQKQTLFKDKLKIFYYPSAILRDLSILSHMEFVTFYVKLYQLMKHIALLWKSFSVFSKAFKIPLITFRTHSWESILSAEARLCVFHDISSLLMVRMNVGILLCTLTHPKCSPKSFSPPFVNKISQQRS
jgi:hypothetical protein